jgi:hypothetical protein
MLVINIKTKGKSDYQFEWSGNADEFRRLWEHCEDASAREGHDAKDMAAQVIATSSNIKTRNEVETRGMSVWIVYGVLRFAADNVDLLV